MHSTSCNRDRLVENITSDYWCCIINRSNNSSFFIKNNIDKVIREENQKKSNLDLLDKQLDDILKIAISYPYLETKKFCDTWGVDKAEVGDDVDKYQRYNVFCNLVFNYLSRLAEHCNYDLECIQK